MIIKKIFMDGTSLDIKCKSISKYEVSGTLLKIESYNRSNTIDLDLVNSYSVEQGVFSYDGNPILISGILNVLNNHLK